MDLHTKRYVDEAIMPPIKCPVCKGTDFVTT